MIQKQKHDCPQITCLALGDPASCENQVVHGKPAETQTWLSGHSVTDWFYDGVVVRPKLSFDRSVRCYCQMTSEVYFGAIHFKF